MGQPITNKNVAEMKIQGAVDRSKTLVFKILESIRIRNLPSTPPDSFKIIEYELDL